MSTTLLQGQAAQPIKVGSIKTPTQNADQILNGLLNKTNWKLPTAIFSSTNWDLVREVAHAMNFNLGGCEIVQRAIGKWEVSSQGYYHYVGA